MSAFVITLLLATLSCSLVAGFLFAYAVVIMPGIKTLDDEAFIRAFQVTDRVIQDNHPLFMVVWLGSALSLVICAFLGFGLLEGVDRVLLLVATALYLVGVQISTVRVHLPLNNALQNIDPVQMNADELRAARLAFEPRWNRSNEIRTFIACCVAGLLLVLALRV